MVAFTTSGGITIVDRSGKATVLSTSDATAGLAWDPSGDAIWTARQTGGGANTGLWRVALDGKLREVIQRVLAIPQKCFDRDLVTFLKRAEIDALLAAPDQATHLGRRDHALLAVAVQTGLRVSELTGLRVEDCAFGHGAHVRCHGKGRKERCTPLTRQTAAVMRAWLAENRATATDLVFPSQRGTPLSRDAVERLVSKYAEAAARRCPTLARKHVTPHVLRHSTAVGLLEAGVDRAVIALWLGHESVETTQLYLDADLAMKERALARTAPLRVGSRRFRPRVTEPSRQLESA
jgi:site-specific recombinase XerD